jgi:thiol-disulfide isomerase/thioredoxin
MRTSTVIAAALATLAVAGFLAYRTLPLEPAAESSAVDTSPGAQPSSEPEALPEFTLATLDGAQRSIHDWPGEALVINFWATWCPPCIRVVGVAVDRLEPVRAFAEDMAFNYPLLVGQSDAMEAAAAFGIEFFALPFTVFTDSDANVLGVHTGELHTEDLENLATVLEALAAGSIDLENARARIAGRI